LSPPLVGTRPEKADLGSEFLGAVDAVIRRIADWPKAARPVVGVKESLAVRRSPVPRFPYYVAYMEEPDAIRVLAVAHTRRRPLYWRRRL
jgi:plasmid stabilization system protein ParE